MWFTKCIIVNWIWNYNGAKTQHTDYMIFSHQNLNIIIIFTIICETNVVFIDRGINSFIIQTAIIGCYVIENEQNKNALKD